MATANTLHSLIADLDDRDKLMLIDFIADSLSDDLGCELHDGLTVAFEIAEQGFSGVFTPLYPAGARDPKYWDVWRLERDRRLGAAFLRRAA